MTQTAKPKGIEPDCRWRCVSCGQVVNDEPGPLRECSNEGCAATFVAEFDDNNCPECGRPFTRRTADYGCVDCTEEMEEEEGFACGQACADGGFHLLAAIDLSDEDAEALASDDPRQRRVGKAAHRAARAAAVSAAQAAAASCRAGAPK